MRPAALLLILVTIVFTMPSAYGVCLDPSTFISGYQIPLNEEIETSIAIVIGEVTGEQRIFDDPSDPEYFSATIYTCTHRQDTQGSAAGNHNTLDT